MTLALWLTIWLVVAFMVLLSLRDWMRQRAMEKEL